MASFIARVAVVCGGVSALQLKLNDVHRVSGQFVKTAAEPGSGCLDDLEGMKVKLNAEGKEMKIVKQIYGENVPKSFTVLGAFSDDAKTILSVVENGTGEKKFFFPMEYVDALSEAETDSETDGTVSESASAVPSVSDSESGTVPSVSVSETETESEKQKLKLKAWEKVRDWSKAIVTKKIMKSIFSVGSHVQLSSQGISKFSGLPGATFVVNGFKPEGKVTVELTSRLATREEREVLTAENVPSKDVLSKVDVDWLHALNNKGLLLNDKDDNGEQTFRLFVCGKFKDIQFDYQELMPVTDNELNGKVVDKMGEVIEERRQKRRLRQERQRTAQQGGFTGDYRLGERFGQHRDLFHTREEVPFPVGVH